MGEKEHKEVIQAIREYKKKVLTSKESALKFLVSTGVCTPTGNLRKPPKR